MSKPDRQSAEGEESPIDPNRSACVLIGVDEYRHLGPLPSVRHNLAQLRQTLIDPEIWGIPTDRIVTVANPRTPAELITPIRQAARQAEDTLLIYYAGHGLIHPQEQQLLLLTMPDSVEDQPETCSRADDVRAAIEAEGAASRRVLILDCCFSGRALVVMSSTDSRRRGLAAAQDTLRNVKGGYVMASSARDRPSHAPSPKKCTAFTGALVEVMREGVPNGPEMLSLHRLLEATRTRMAHDWPNLPQDPQDQSSNGVGELRFVHNMALRPPPPPPVPSPSRGVRVGAVLLAGVLGMAGGLAVPPALELVERLAPAPATGACSDRAMLLDHSDALDKQQVSNERIEGLSALALVPGTEPPDALALADHEPGRLFPLTLGQPDALEVSARRGITLRKADGENFPAWFDGESLVVEQGGRTMLIGSESEPAIRRFDISTGRQIGADFPIPENLRYWPEGGAAIGRSIESLAVSPNGRYLYAGWEAPLVWDGDTRGRNMLRIQRYVGAPGQAYVPDRQFAYFSGDGLHLVELAAVDDDRLLALERQYVVGLGNAIRVVELSLKGAQDVTGQPTLFRLPADVFVHSELLFDLADCPLGGPGQVYRPAGKHGNPLVDNVEGMALGDVWEDGPHKGWRPLYLVSDDNGNSVQVTRVYLLAVRL